jgi:fission process protein 1
MSTESLSKAAQVQVDILADKNVNSTDSEIRYLAYGARLRTALRAGSRYIAYVCFSHTLRDSPRKD